MPRMTVLTVGDFAFCLTTPEESIGADLVRGAIDALRWGTRLVGGASPRQTRHTNRLFTACIFIASAATGTATKTIVYLRDRLTGDFQSVAEFQDASSYTVAEYMAEARDSQAQVAIVPSPPSWPSAVSKSFCKGLTLVIREASDAHHPFYARNLAIAESTCRYDSALIGFNVIMCTSGLLTGGAFFRLLYTCIKNRIHRDNPTAQLPTHRCLIITPALVAILGSMVAATAPGVDLAGAYSCGFFAAAGASAFPLADLVNHGSREIPRMPAARVPLLEDQGGVQNPNPEDPDPAQLEANPAPDDDGADADVNIELAQLGSSQ